MNWDKVASFVDSEMKAPTCIFVISANAPPSQLYLLHILLHLSSVGYK